jgi:hypothetical protein
MAKERKFIDGVESISFMEGMVHMELFNYIARSQKQKGQRPEMEVTEELIFTPKGFLRAFSAMQNLVGQLEKAGIIKKNDDDDVETVEAEVIDDSIDSPNWSSK